MELESYIIHHFGIAPSELDAIVQLFHVEKLSKGDFYLKQDGRCDKLSFIKTGILRVYCTTHDKEVTQWISTKGSFIAELSSLIFETPARWNIQAITDAELYTISRENYRAIGQLVPSWHELEKLFIAKCFGMLEDRVFTHLAMTAEERYEQFFQNNKELFHQVPLQYIASMLGMTPETFSRIRKRSLG